MNASRVAQATFLFPLIAGAGNATRYLTNVKTFKVKIKMYWWDNGRDEPYRMTFNKKDFYFAYTFNTHGQWQTITVEGEKQSLSTSIIAPDGSLGQNAQNAARNA